MFEIKVEAQFKADYKRTMRIHPQLKSEFKAAVAELAAHGSLPAEYGAHELSNPGGNYNGHIDFHLSDGLVDVVVLYLPHKTNLVISGWSEWARMRSCSRVRRADCSLMIRGGIGIDSRPIGQKRPLFHRNCWRHPVRGCDLRFSSSLDFA